MNCAVKRISAKILVAMLAWLLAVAAAVEAQEFVGSGGCAAAGCHGGPQHGAHAWSSSFTVWAVDDPHARAYVTLLDERSIRMAELLKDKLNGQPAHQARACLDCHSLQPPGGARTVLNGLLMGGVSCEACHGAASNWRDVHYLVGWKKKGSAPNNASPGFNDLSDVSTRATTCIACHVGRPGREVDHDLIAAGHPRLAFELGSYLAQMPRHWSAKKEQATPGFEAKLWAVGQVATLAAAVDLLANHLSQPAHGKDAWPEFADFDCFDCHHGLADRAWRRQRTPRDGKLGLPTWGSWYLPLARRLAETGPAVAANTNAAAELGKLAEDVQSAWHGTGLKKAMPAAKTAAAALKQWQQQLNTVSYTLDETKKLLAWAARQDEVARDWNGSAQVYLAIAAINDAYCSQAGNTQPAMSQLEAWNSTFQSLQFPNDFTSPRDFTPDDFQSRLAKLREWLIARP